MTALLGTRALVRLILRRDRIRLPVWILAIVGIVAASGGAVADAYSTPQAIQTYADTIGTSPASIAMAGPPVALDSVGGIVVYETSFTALLGVALMAVFLTVRHTRAEEEEGRTELLQSTVVGRLAPVAATLSVMTVASLVVGAACAASLTTLDVPADGLVVYGAAIAAFGVVFAAVATVAAQLMTHARGAVGLSASVLGVAFILRALGDVRENGLSWLSPMGWSQQVRAFDDNRWWPLLLSLGLTAVLVVAAVTVVGGRDLGAGLVPPRPGPATAARLLSSPAGLALRLQRGALIGWSAGIFVYGLTFGSFSGDFETMLESNPDLEQYLALAGEASLENAFFSMALLMLSLIAAAFAVSSALRVRGEETSGRLEALLATGASRTRLMLGYLAVTALGALLLVVLGGLGVGLAVGLTDGDLGAIRDMVGNALVYAPAVLVFGAIAVVLVGWFPRIAVAAWAAVAFGFVVGWLGDLLGVPGWLGDLSPFTHTPAVPSVAVEALPLVVLGLVAGLGTVVGLVGFRRRDIG